MITSRRYELDWLRVIAFLVLIYFHAAIAFIPGGIPMIQNADTSRGLEYFVEVSHLFRLALLFFVAGVGVAFASRRRSPREFIAERSRLLLIPLLFGILVVVPPMVYTEKLFTGAFDGSFWQFYPQFFTRGVYPGGNLSWHHFWFIAYLFLYCLLILGLLRWLGGDAGHRFQARIAECAAGFGLYWLILPLLLFELPLRALFPGFHDLIHDWANFAHWFVIFLAGYLIANFQSLLEDAARLRRISLIGATVATALLCLLFYREHGFGLEPNEPYIVVKYVVYCLLRMAMVWCAILTCVGYAARYLRFGNPLLTYLNEAVYPLFILHLTVIVILSYFAVPLSIGLWFKYLLITTATMASIIAIYHFAIRPFNIMRTLFGVKPRVEARTGFEVFQSSLRQKQ